MALHLLGGSRRRTLVLGGGGARGAAQVGALLALFEADLEPPSRIIGASVGALNGATVAAYPSLAGTAMLRELWLSPQARGVFRAHPLTVVLSRLRTGSLTALPAANVRRVIDRAIQLIGVDTFEGLRVPLEVVATDIGAGRPHVFSRGELAPALQASTAIPGVFPAVEIEGTRYLDGGIVDNMPISMAVEEGARDVLGIELMAGGELERHPRNWPNLMARTLQLTLHHRVLADFERLRHTARVVLLCPVLPPEVGSDMRPGTVEALIEATRKSTLQLLASEGRRLFRRSAIHYLDLDFASSAAS
jgi:NTE family protein